MSEKERFFGDETKTTGNETDDSGVEKPKDGQPDLDLSSSEKRPTIKNLEEVVSLDYLKAISQAGSRPRTPRPANRWDGSAKLR